MKRWLSLLLSLALVISLIPTALAATPEATEAANALYSRGLFNGTGIDANGNPIFELDRAPTRHEAVTMLVRLLGKENEAKSGIWTTPFTDVAEWAKPYVGYAYANGLTDGVSKTAFGGEETVSASQYLTFVLRTLGYSSGTDFQWDKAWELSDKIGLTDGRYNASSSNFTRGDVAIVSLQSLSVSSKDQSVQQSPIVDTNSSNTEMLQGTWIGVNTVESGEFYEIYQFIGANLSCAYYVKVNDTILYSSYEEGTFTINGNTLKLLKNKIYIYAGQNTATKVSSEVKTIDREIHLTENKLSMDQWNYVKVDGTDLASANSIYDAIKSEVMGHVASESSSDSYAYLAASDFRSIRNQYSNAVPRCAYVVAFTDKNGDNCVLVDLYWKIINDYHDVILHNLTTGRVINDPVTYYGNMANRQYGASKLHYMDLQLEVLEHLAGGTKNGTYVGPEVLGQ